MTVLHVFPVKDSGKRWWDIAGFQPFRVNSSLKEMYVRESNWRSG